MVAGSASHQFPEIGYMKIQSKTYGSKKNTTTNELEKKKKKTAYIN